MPTTPSQRFQGKIIDWSNSDMPVCDICKSEAAPYDVPTIHGPWANLGESCFKLYCTPERSKVGFFRATSLT